MSEEASAPPRRRRRRVLVAVAAAIAVVLAGGAAAAFVLLRGASEQVLDHVPASTDVVAIAYLDPAASQKINLFRLASHFPSLGSEQELTDKVKHQIDLALEGSGLTHEDLGWVGSEVGFAVDLPNLNEPHAALLVATDDADAAAATLQKLRSGPASDPSSWTSESYEGVDVWVGKDTGGGDLVQAVVDGVVVIGDSRSMVTGIIDASNGKVPRLQDDSVFKAAMSDLPSAKLGFTYVNTQPLIAMLEQTDGFPALSTTTSSTDSDLKAIQAVAISVSAQPDGLVFDSTERIDRSKLSADRLAQLGQPAHPNPLLTSVPGDAWGVVSLEHVDTGLQSILDQARTTDPEIGQQLDALGVPDLIRTLTGDLVIEGGPGSEAPGGAILLGTTDDGQMQAAFDQLAGVVSTLTHLRWTSTAYNGTRIRVLDTSQFGLPLAPAYAVVNHAGVITTSVEEMRRIIDAAGGGQNITTATGFVEARAKVPPNTLFYIDVRGLIAEISSELPADERAQFEAEVEPDLQHVTYVVSGGESTPDRSTGRLFIKVS